MQSLKRFVEWYLGVPAVEAGQGTAWNFTWRTPWPAGLPAWLVLLLALAAAALVVSVYRRDARSVSTRGRIGLISLRLAAVLLLLLFLSELRLSIDRTGLPVVVVLIDDSASMQLEDRYPDENLSRAAQRLLASPQSAEPSRLNLARSVLTARDGRFLKQLVRRHKLRVYRFSETATPIGEREYLTTDDIDELLPLLEKLAPEGAQTRPGPAVQKVLEDLRGTPPSAIVVLTDGIASTSDADRLSAGAETARNRLVPIYAVAIGSEEASRDLQIYGLLADEVAFVGDPIQFTARLKAFGYADRDVSVALRHAGSGEELAREVVRTGQDGEPVQVELAYTPPRSGEFDYVLQVEALPNETNTRNNETLPHHVSVRQEPIRVLLADAVPRYEFRYLKHLLEREALRDSNTLKVDTVLQDADLQYADEDRTALRHFPVKREELFEYDVIILGDLDPALLGDAVLENLREFVREGGGGLVMIAGPAHNPLSYRGTPLEVLLPVELSGLQVPSAEMPVIDSFRPELTLEGRKSSNIFRFAETEEQSVAVWRELPELYWLSRATEMKPGAVVFARHPAETDVPVISMQRFGAGKILFHATDELYRWRFRRGDIYYGRYWVQAIRWLTRSKLLGRDRGAKLESDRQEYEQGETVTLRLRFLDERLMPSGEETATVMVERRGGGQQTVKLSRQPAGPAIFEGQLTRVAEGSYHAWVVSPTFKEAPPSEDFVVQSESRELTNRNLDRADLLKTAELTRGRFYTLADVAALPGDIPRGQPVSLQTQDPIPLWNRWELLLLFAMLLTAEWLLRKRWRLV